MPWAEGIDLVAMLRGQAQPRDAVLLEHGNMHGAPAYCGVRGPDYTYASYFTTGEEEYYDLVVDPFEVTNVADDPDYATQVAQAATLTATLCQPLPPQQMLPAGAQ
jgi:hypothetical protein